MIKINNVSIKNFLSVGSVTQAVSFDQNNLTLILGENMDLGGDGSRNGTGKTVLIQAISYALFNTALNDIKKDNLVNRTNAKNMLVALDFSVDGVDYRIERGRKPAILRFYINNEIQQEKDDAQGDSRETQAAIERILGMSAVMFQQIVALNTYSVPFLAMRVSDQRAIIEQLLGVTLLSEKAEVVKERIRQTKEQVQTEEFRLKAIGEANKRITEQISASQRRQRLWQEKHNVDFAKLVDSYNELSKIDIEVELAAHKQLSAYLKAVSNNAEYDAAESKAAVWQDTRTTAVAAMEESLSVLLKLDSEHELKQHAELAVHNEMRQKQAELVRAVAQLDIDLKREIKNQEKLATECSALHDNKCYACGKEHFDLALLNEKSRALASTEKHLEQKHAERAALVSQQQNLADPPKTHYKTLSEAVKHSALVDSVRQNIEYKLAEQNPHSTQLVRVELGVKPETHYATESDAVKHNVKIEGLLTQIAEKHEETDPYAEQIAEMQTNALQEIDWGTINALTTRMEHEKFVLDLLTSKNSFVRKRILNQNLVFLNSRLTHYLERMGLPHNVVFQDDLSVDITEYGRELDYGNLSRGESTRLMLSLSWAFGDVWQALYRPINCLFVDELIDNGLDTQGAENAVTILKEMARERRKAVFLISHKEELIARVNSVLRVTKENGFSTYSSSDTV